MKFRDLRQQIEQTESFVIAAPMPKESWDRDVKVAIDYIKGYCNKHIECNESCKLYDIKIEHCIFFDSVAGPPCDWELPKREEEEKDV